MFRKHAAWMCAWSLCVLNGGIALTSVFAQEPAKETPKEAPAPTEKKGTGAWQHLRMDEVELAKHGDGNVERGLNKIGAQGYSLQFVVSVPDTSAAGYHYFKRGPWAGPGERPQVEFKRLDSGEITKLGGDSFNHGLEKLEGDNWQLVAVTSGTKGVVGYHYFERPKPSAAENSPQPEKSSTPAP